jgi:enoyl-[acyl-carrier protein] reductase I
VFATAEAKWGVIDFLVHAIAFSDKDQLQGRYIDTTADNFANTMQISCYSFTALARRAEQLMPRGGALLTLTYYGAEKWMPHYNVMGVAKAALEASVRYLARSKRWPRRELVISVTFSNGTSIMRRCGAA